MISVDTNIILRIILDDDAAQIVLIRELIARDTLFVSLTVLLEAGWVLESRYRMPRSDVCTALSSLLTLDGISVARPQIARWAIARYLAGADLADMIHVASAVKLGAFATLDKRLARAAGDQAPVTITTLA